MHLRCNFFHTSCSPSRFLPHSLTHFLPQIKMNFLAFPCLLKSPLFPSDPAILSDAKLITFETFQYHEPKLLGKSQSLNWASLKLTNKQDFKDCRVGNVKSRTKFLWTVFSPLSLLWSASVLDQIVWNVQTEHWFLANQKAMNTESLLFNPRPKVYTNVFQ